MTVGYQCRAWLLTPGMEITGGSLGHGLGIAVGACLGLKQKKSDAFVYNLLSDGELNEGSTWEAVMCFAWLCCTKI